MSRPAGKVSVSWICMGMVVGLVMAMVMAWFDLVFVHFWIRSHWAEPRKFRITPIVFFGCSGGSNCVAVGGDLSGLLGS